MKRISLVAGLAVALSVSYAAAEEFEPAKAVACKGTVMNIVAHQDDDLVYFGAAKVKDLDDGKCVITVYTTAGDANLGSDYWLQREKGAVVSAETLARAKTHKATKDSSIKLNGRNVATRTSKSDKRLSFVFLRLPGGNLEQADVQIGQPSLLRLFNGDIAKIKTVADASADGLAQAATYTRSTLKATLLGLMDRYRPQTVRIQNYLDAPNDGAGGEIDHSDHVVTAKLAFDAAKTYAARQGKRVDKLVVGYRGAETFKLQENVFGDRLQVKLKAFADYAKRDRFVCIDALDCVAYVQDYTTFSGFPRWLRREYPVTAKKTPFNGAQIIGFGGRCLETPSGAEGAVLRMSTCGGPTAMNQQWAFIADTGQLKNAFSGKCANSAAGGVVAQETCGPGSSGETWLLDADDELTTFGSFGCLTAQGDSSDDGLAPRFQTCTFSARQLFGFGKAPIAPKPHTIVGDLGGLCLNMSSAGASDGNVTGETCNASVNQQWFFTPAGSLRNRTAGRCALVLDDTSDDGQPIVGDECAIGRRDVERWGYDVELRGIVNLGGSDVAGKCFDQRGPSGDPGVQIQTFTCVDAPAQKFTISGAR